MIGALAILAASFAAGCGGGTSGGHIAAQEAPAESAPADGTAPAPATSPGDEARSQALGAFPPADERAPSFRQFSQFDKSRAGRIFQPPASVVAAQESAESESAPDASAPQSSAPPASEPQQAPGPSGPATGEPSGGTTPSGGSGDTKIVNDFTANLDVDGSPVIAKAGTQIPAENPLFTVDSVTADKTVLKLNSGSFADGDTITIAKGASVTLSNPASGNTVVIKVVDIAKPGATR